MLGYFPQLCLFLKGFCIEIGIDWTWRTGWFMYKTSLLLLFPPLTTLLIIPPSHSLSFFVLLLKWRWKHCAFPCVSLFCYEVYVDHMALIPLFPLLIGQWNLFWGAGVLRWKREDFGPRDGNVLLGQNVNVNVFVNGKVCWQFKLTVQWNTDRLFFTTALVPEVFFSIYSI